MQNISVLISVYSKELPERLSKALESILNQTIVPNEIVIIKDGPLTEKLDFVINDLKEKYSSIIKVFALPQNVGLGKALAFGVEKCSNEIIARMDSDDISVSNRLEIQLKKILEGNYDLIGSNIEEFNENPCDLNTFRNLPEFEMQIKRFSKFRNPFNHPTVMFRKSIVLNAGNYSGDYLFFEDWHLFIRMLQLGAKVYNVQQNLLFFRVNNKIELLKRRSGYQYIKYEYKFSKFLLSVNHINILEWLFYLISKIPIRLLPPTILKFIYYKFARI